MYDESIRRLEETGEFPPDGMELHCAFVVDGNVRVSEIRDSREQLDAFGERLMIVERLVESWNLHDPDAVARCYAPDAVSRDITLSEPLRGREAIRNAAAMYMNAFPDIHFDIRRVACDGDVICEEWRATGSHEGDLMGLRPTHRQGSTLGCNVIQVREDGLIYSETTYWDAAGLYRQLGALRELARAAE